MNAYGSIGVRATGLIRRGETPAEAWRIAAREEFPDMEPSQKKSCPRGAFLGLCEDGFVIGVPRGTYTRSRDNKQYAVEAASRLRRDPRLASRGPAALWAIVMDGREKNSNHQMDVVLALWNAGLLVGSSSSAAV
jgi:hypothetical protein